MCRVKRCAWGCKWIACHLAICSSRCLHQYGLLIPYNTSMRCSVTGMIRMDGREVAASTVISLCLLLGLSCVSAQPLSANAPAPSSSTNWTGVKWPAGWSAFPPVAGPSFDYAEALHKAFIYMRIQRSGNLTASDHIAWRSNSCFTCTVGNARFAYTLTFMHFCATRTRK